MTVPPRWLADAVLYQIYPPSFADSDGDGIGDLPGIVERLDYLEWLGVDAVWLNPCFDSPFRDGGYDITDYLTIAPRYGTNEDLARLVDQARRRGIRVLLDLVAGHTSDQHPWFLRSADGGDRGAERYIWAAEPAPGMVPGPGARGDWYLPNYFDHQPALNFGYARSTEGEPWRQPVDAPGPRANRAALREIMTHWLDMGVSGFRVDMANSLVKDDPGVVETGRLWGRMRQWLASAYPDAALLAEWGNPAIAVRAGFHADFFLHFAGRAFLSLWNNNAGEFPLLHSDDPCYFDASGAGSIAPFLAEWREAVAHIAGAGFVALPTANHDFSRLAAGSRTGDQLKVAMTFVLTWPTLPTIYYGDEIGMRHLTGLPGKEGSINPNGGNRSGSRTPMQWDIGDTAGFSSAPLERLYLPVDPSAARPTVAAERADQSSLLHVVRNLIGLRRQHKALGSAGSVEIIHEGYPLVYLRRHDDQVFLVVVNPAAHTESAKLAADVGRARQILGHNVAVDHATVTAKPFGYAIYRVDLDVLTKIAPEMPSSSRHNVKIDADPEQPAGRR